jgi:hypothetical protein
MAAAAPASRVLALASSYFLAVFAIGVVLGVVRTLWLAPVLGERAAELLELPLMIAASWLVARSLTRGAWRDLGVAGAAAAGAVALALLVGAELGVVVLARGQSIAEYAASRDPVSGVAYIVALLAYAAMPALARERGARSR